MRLALALPVLLAACTVTRDHAPDSAAPRAALVPSTATPAVATLTAASPESVTRPSSPDGSEPLDPRYANPDSAIRRYLEDLHFNSSGVSPFGECPDDMGIEHESIDVAAVSLRPLRRTRDAVDSAGFSKPLRTVE